jgi:DNA-binding NtrC family response regulator
MLSEYTVLVVDDEKVIRNGYSRILSSEGFHVLTAANGQEALELLESETVHVIVCDLKMPVMGALGVLEQTSVLYPDVPVVIITGHGTVESTIECMKKGAYYFVGKPIRADYLIQVTKKALEQHHLERQTRD